MSQKIHRWRDSKNNDFLSIELENLIKKGQKIVQVVPTHYHGGTGELIKALIITEEPRKIYNRGPM